ncbi:hypothetical protein CERSUDRAFT_119714 [Gelatoporia subvermispora B]|uniref:Uncharacterized protein n=1 Tax=Ceriporiopsis subvermispora (strain B) TaxID=914234 RepID=M2P831_CERS8|nr:hypothetical protein CERSUDRAFT_119714 [Gelatoporia subvermispora B]
MTHIYPQVHLSEEYVQECFHSYLKSSLTQAKVEGLLGADVLSSAEGDLMITGPALCLYFAALRSTTNPPSVPLPKRHKGQTGAPVDLSSENCPPSFRSFWLVWSQSVPEIQNLTPEYQHDLARIICGLPPISQPPNPRLNGIAADLRAVAIEISMRRTFQDRYASDLQAALDAGTDGISRFKASFVPPPVYDAPLPTAAPSSPPTPSSSRRSVDSASSPRSSTSSVPSSPRSPKRSILTPESPAIEFIRETLYAALGEVLERTASLRRLLRSDPGRAYFASVAFAILDIATSSATLSSATKSDADVLHSTDDGEPAVRGVLGKTLTLSECPPELRPFMQELCAIGRMAHEMEEEDSETSVQALQRGEEPPVPRLERVRDVISGGVGHVFDDDRESVSGHGIHGTERRRRRTSTENRAVAFANRINGLALGMTKLRAFRERQELVFKVLAGVGSS